MNVCAMIGSSAGIVSQVIFKSFPMVFGFFIAKIISHEVLK